MKQGLQLRLNQQLIITPQLQQAIRLMHLSTLELHQELQLALEKNPFLEQVDLYNEINIIESQGKDLLDVWKELEKEKIPKDLPLDSTWEEIYTAGTPSGTSNDYQQDELPAYQGETLQSLQDYLMWQVDLTPFTEIDRAIATLIVDSINDIGYLTISLQEICDSIGDKNLTLKEIEVVLKRIQRFDPVGVGARDLKDCLLIQLSQYAPNVPMLFEARLIVSNYLDMLANHDFRSLMRATKFKENVLKDATLLIKSLYPRPGELLNKRKSEYIIPDVLVRKINKIWKVELNIDSLPRIKINQQYASIRDNYRYNEKEKHFINSNLKEAKWLIKSVETRNETLLRVTQCIIERQQAFFEYGEEHMRPMVLTDIAQAVDMHESTISRITTQKYLHSPRGIFELKYFFSSHINTDNGIEASSTAIRALVKKLISTENPVKPLSDSKLTSMLSKKGIIIARRTVAKYRESLFIPPSNQRKQLI